MKNLLFSLGLLALGGPALAQKTVPAIGPFHAKGLVRDHITAEPLPWVRVQVQGDTAIHTVTDAKGEFALWVPRAAQATLEFERHSGARRYDYVTQTVPLATLEKPLIKVWLAHPPINWTAHEPTARMLRDRQRREARREAKRAVAIAADTTKK